MFTFSVRRLRCAAAVATIALAGTGCGSTLSDSELNTQARESFSLSVSKTPANPETAGPEASGMPADEQAGTAGLATGADAAVTAGRETTVSTAATGRPGSGSAPQSSGGGTAANGTAAAQPGAGSATKAGGTATATAGTPAAPSASKAPIALGSFGTGTGPLGRILLPVPQGARAWAADVNARGGVAGHPVRLLMADDGGDPNKALAIAKRMVEQDRVIAFFAEFAPTTIQAVLPYLEQHQIPVIAGCNCFQGTAESPMSFQVGTGSKLGLAWQHLLPFTAYAGTQKKASMQYCREASSCKLIADNVRKLAPQVGVEIVHEAQTTLTQPDYTAEVLAARNAGANLLILATESFSAIRTIRSARRQDWNPLVVVQQSAADLRFAADGGADVEGVLIGGSILSWDSPKMADYRAAIDRYVPGGTKANMSQLAYVGGKLIEKMANGWSDNPTSADVLKGLYALRGETLGDILPPLSYREGVGHDESNNCVIPLRVESGRIVPKDGDNYLCAPGWKPVQK